MLLLPSGWSQGYNQRCSANEQLAYEGPVYSMHHEVGPWLSSAQDWSLQCPSNAVWPFKIYFSQNNPSKPNPNLQKEDVTWSPRYNLPAIGTNRRMGIVTTESGVRWLILDSSHCTGNMYHIYSCTSLIWVLCFISIYLDWRLGFEPSLQLKG